MRTSSRLALALTALPLLGCRSATEIRVEVTTDVPCTAQTSTIIAVGTVDGVETRLPTASASSCADGHVGALVIVPSGDDGAEVAFRVVTSSTRDPADCREAGYAGCIVARRALHFVPHSSLRVVVPMRGTCTDKACIAEGELATCVEGRCVPATIPDPGACTGSGCDESSLPGGGAADAGPEAGADSGRDAGPDATLPDAGPEGGVDATTPDAGDGGVEGGPSVGAWVPMASASTINLEARTNSAGVWTGSALLVWGGSVMFGFAEDGGTYDPIADKWTRLPASPLGARDLHTMVWSGTEAIIWGGDYYADGARVDPVKGVWRLLEPVPASTAGRQAHVAVWATTTNEMIIWGGKSNAGNLADGAAYAPATGKWRVIAASPLGPRDGASGVWNGSKMIVFGGVGCGLYCGDAAAYDPKTDKWSAVSPPPSQLDARPLAAAVATGASRTLATFFGGGIHGLDTGRSNGATYDASRDAWTPIEGPAAAILPDPGRYAASVWWGANRLWFWGGYANGSGDNAREEGASYDPATSTWAAMPAGGPAKRAAAVTVWTGTEAIVWSGETGAASAPVLYADGKRFRP